jgi:diaminohydroxyphosphoribosylaminopyrimidine deaminase / 5-amino-6-(5-phosphoribosylamino)uracil reductase
MNLSQQTLYMQRALDLAELGCEQVSPNPMVGCVIVHNDMVIGEGYHQKYGEAHAEVNAINSVKDKGLLPESTAYVTLEPCAHYGKTPPCADLLIKHKIKKVVVCNLDPNPLVAGKGIEKLKNEGIEMEVGLLAEKGQQINRRFFKAQTEKIPYIIIKWAETADGYMATADGKPLKITNTVSDMLVHKWRSEEDGIMVGSKTIKTDNPNLNTRHWPEGKNPVRIVIDRALKINELSKVFDKKQKTIIINTIKNHIDENLEYLKIEPGPSFLENALFELNKLGIQSVFVEGGPELINLFFEKNIFDEIRILKNNISIKNGIESPKIPSGITLVSRDTIIEDFLTIYKR